MKESKSLRNVLLLNFLLASLIPLLLLAGSVYVLEISRLRHTLFTQSALLTRSLRREVNAFTEFPIQLLREVYKDIFVSHNSLSRQVRLDSAVQSHPFFESIGFITADARLSIISPYSRDMEGIDMSGQEYISEPRPMFEPVWSGTFISTVSGEPTITLSIRFPSGWMIANLRISRLYDITDEIRLEETGISCIFDNDGTVISHPNRNWVYQRRNFRTSSLLKASYAGFEGSDLFVFDDTPVVGSVNRIEGTGWHVVFIQDQREAFVPLYRMTFFLMISLFLAFIIAVGLSLIQFRRTLMPLVELTVWTDRISVGDYSFQAPREGYLEIDHLVERFQGMSEAIRRREAQLHELNQDLERRVHERTEELEQSIETLRQTQAQLILSEKMASLGGLVAGIAHEINTPVGVAVTASTHLEGILRRFESRYREDELTRSELEQFVGSGIQSVKMIISNLQRAVEIMRSFKQIAVDQSSDESRRINLKDYIEELLLSLKPELKHTRHTVAVECDPGIEVETLPGSLSQVLTNLIMNSQVHGFEGIDAGTITIEVSLRDKLMIRYRDNGVGMPEENLRRIYDPFFTTRRGRGGSGLGMHIVYNIVTQKLMGSITSVSRPGEGIEVSISIPVSS